MSPVSKFTDCLVIQSLMPKGVEHIGCELRTAAMILVIQSLMPKGVEHMVSQIPSPAAIAGDSISDAERR